MVRKDTREAWLLKDEGLGAERAPENEVGIYRLIESYYPGTRRLAWKNGEVGSRGAVRESCGVALRWTTVGVYRGGASSGGPISSVYSLTTTLPTASLLLDLGAKPQRMFNASRQ